MFVESMLFLMLAQLIATQCIRDCSHFIDNSSSDIEFWLLSTVAYSLRIRSTCFRNDISIEHTNDLANVQSARLPYLELVRHCWSIKTPMLLS